MRNEITLYFQTTHITISSHSKPLKCPQIKTTQTLFKPYHNLLFYHLFIKSHLHLNFSFFLDISSNTLPSNLPSIFQWLLSLPPPPSPFLPSLALNPQYPKNPQPLRSPPPFPPPQECPSKLQ